MIRGIHVHVQRMCNVAGTFNNQTLQQEVADCVACLGGHYCDAPGLSEPAGMCLGIIRVQATRVFMSVVM